MLFVLLRSLTETKLQKHVVNLHYNGSPKNDVICHNSDCLQFSVSLTVLPFMFDSVRI